MKSEVKSLLQCTGHQYDMLVFLHFQLWCEMHATTNEDLQSLLANTAIEQWWQTEYAKLQRNFIAIATPYKGYCNKHDMERMYRIETIHIRNLYPKPLIHAVRGKQYSITGNPLLN